MTRKSSTTIRISEQSRQELKALAAHMRISQAAVMEILIKDRYQQETRTMNSNTYYISEQMLGDDATKEDARHMVEILDQYGYNVAYGDRLGQDEDVIKTVDWELGLDIISKKKYSRPQ